MLTDQASLAQRVSAHPGWFHRIDLGNGLVTPGIDDSPLKLKNVHLPRTLEGMTVLDIGAWDGFFSFECERRGAKRVVAADWYSWQGEGKRGFNIARDALASKVEDVEVKVEGLSAATLGTFDFVLFLGVLYHAEDPMRYLRIVRSLCHDTAIIETLVDAVDYPRPAMVFYPGDDKNNDPSNFWGPNRKAVEAMLKEVGFRMVQMVGKYRNRMAFHAML